MTKSSKYFPVIDAGRNRKVEVTRGRLPNEVFNSGSRRWEDRVTGRPTRDSADEPTAEALRRAGIISSDPNAKRAEPAGSSPALRIACPVCHAPAGSYCSKTVPYALGARQTIAHKRRREEEERTR